jgi:YaiO family outer membrane protein
LDTGYISEQYDAHRVDGHSSYLQVAHTFKNKAVFYTRAEEYFSFDRTDTAVVFGGYYSPLNSLSLHAELYLNNGESKFRPNSQFVLNADFTFNKSWQPILSYRSANYDIINSENTGDVITITPGLRYIYQSMSLEIKHARTRNIDKTTTHVNTIKLNVNYDKLSPYVFYSDGAEGIPPEKVVDISIAGIGATYTLNKRVNLRFDYSREDRKDTYIHQSIGIGLSIFF